MDPNPGMLDMFVLMDRVSSFSSALRRPIVRIVYRFYGPLFELSNNVFNILVDFIHFLNTSRINMNLFVRSIQPVKIIQRIDREMKTCGIRRWDDRERFYFPYTFRKKPIGEEKTAGQV
jgi:hypothetical protein